jgi:hypothetical protein
MYSCITAEEQELSHILEFLKMSKPFEESEDLWMVIDKYKHEAFHVEGYTSLDIGNSEGTGYCARSLRY